MALRSTGVGLGVEHVDLTAQVIKMYQETDEVRIPRYPWLLIRTLDKTTATRSGLIHLPEKQNKTNHEGVVLATWQPFKTKWWDVEEQKWFEVANESSLKPGDHIIFPHYVGLPDSKLNDQDYRYIREEDVAVIVNYHPKGWILNEFADALSVVEGGLSKSRLVASAEELLEKFDIVPKYGYSSKTTSGE